MSVNKFLPHVFVLPEDDANRQIANGFLLEESLRTRQIYVLEEAGGWREVLERFCSIYGVEMDRCPQRFMILLIDFDGRGDRLEIARARLRENWGHLMDKVFILGTWTEPETLKQSLGRSYETIGLEMAKDCREGTDNIWAHAQLRHNAAEIERLRREVRPILFA